MRLFFKFASVFCSALLLIALLASCKKGEKDPIDTSSGSSDNSFTGTNSVIGDSDASSGIDANDIFGGSSSVTEGSSSSSSGTDTDSSSSGGSSGSSSSSSSSGSSSSQESTGSNSSSNSSSTGSFDYNDKNNWTKPV